MAKELSQIRERVSVRRTVRLHLAKIMDSVRRKVDITPELRSPGAPNFAYKLFRNRLRKLGLWDSVRDELAQQRFEELYAAGDRRYLRSAPPPGQFSFPDFDSLPSIRIA